MPSGSHSRDSGGTSSSSSFGSRNYEHDRTGRNHLKTRKIKIKGKVYVLSGDFRFKNLTNLFFIFFLSIATYCFAFLLSTAINDIHQMEENHKLFIATIEKADNNPELIVDGEVTDVLQDRGKWYFVYKFTASDGTIVENQKSQVVYKRLATTPSIGDTVKLATLSTDTDANSLTVPMDYINYTINDNPEYGVTKMGKTISIFFIILFGTIDLILIYFTIRGYVKVIKDGKPENEEGSLLEHCPLCGKEVSSSDYCCSNCGEIINPKNQKEFDHNDYN